MNTKELAKRFKDMTDPYETSDRNREQFSYEDAENWINNNPKEAINYLLDTMERMQDSFAD